MWLKDAAHLIFCHSCFCRCLQSFYIFVKLKHTPQSTVTNRSSRHLCYFSVSDRVLLFGLCLPVLFWLICHLSNLYSCLLYHVPGSRTNIRYISFLFVLFTFDHMKISSKFSRCCLWESIWHWFHARFLGFPLSLILIFEKKKSSFARHVLFFFPGSSESVENKFILKSRKDVTGDSTRNYLMKILDKVCREPNMETARQHK